jgi:hypothetical protein
MGQAAAGIPMNCRDAAHMYDRDEPENLFVAKVFQDGVTIDSKLLPSQQDRLDLKVRELFTLQDLRGDGRLDEEELVRLNQKIAILHYGRDVDREAVKAKYSGLFREQLNPDGRPVPYETFQRYVLQVLNEVDPYDTVAQEMILEQFISEAACARELLARERTHSHHSHAEDYYNSAPFRLTPDNLGASGMSSPAISVEVI